MKLHWDYMSICLWFELFCLMNRHLSSPFLVHFDLSLDLHGSRMQLVYHESNPCRWSGSTGICLGPAVDRPFQLVYVIFGTGIYNGGQEIGKLVLKTRPSVHFVVDTSTAGGVNIDKYMTAAYPHNILMTSTRYVHDAHDIPWYFHAPCPMISPASLAEHESWIHNDTGLLGTSLPLELKLDVPRTCLFNWKYMEIWWFTTAKTSRCFQINPFGFQSPKGSSEIPRCWRPASRAFGRHSKSEPGTISTETDLVHAGPSSAKQNLKNYISGIFR